MLDPLPSQPTTLPTTSGLPLKRALVQWLSTTIEQRLAAIHAAAADAYDGATGEEARAEDKYDTRALEQSYLCAGQNARVVQLRELLTTLHFLEVPDGALERGGPFALVKAVSQGRTTTYFLLPLAIGERVAWQDSYIDVVGIATPVGRALVGCVADDVVAVQIANGRRQLDIASVC